MTISAVSVMLGSMFDYCIMRNASEDGSEVKLPSNLPLVSVTANRIQTMVSLIADVQVGRLTHIVM